MEDNLGETITIPKAEYDALVADRQVLAGTRQVLRILMPMFEGLSQVRDVLKKLIDD